MMKGRSLLHKSLRLFLIGTLAALAGRNAAFAAGARPETLAVVLGPPGPDFHSPLPGMGRSRAAAGSGTWVRALPLHRKVLPNGAVTDMFPRAEAAFDVPPEPLRLPPNLEGSDCRALPLRLFRRKATEAMPKPERQTFLLCADSSVPGRETGRDGGRGITSVLLAGAGDLDFSKQPFQGAWKPADSCFALSALGPQALPLRLCRAAGDTLALEADLVREGNLRLGAVPSPAGGPNGAGGADTTDAADGADSVGSLGKRSSPPGAALKVGWQDADFDGKWDARFDRLLLDADGDGNLSGDFGLDGYRASTADSPLRFAQAGVTVEFLGGDSAGDTLRFAILRGQEGLSLQKALVGTEAPDFAFTDAKGQAQRISWYRSRPVLLYFPDPGCAECLVREMAQLRQFMKERYSRRYHVFLLWTRGSGPSRPARDPARAERNGTAPSPQGRPPFRVGTVEPAVRDRFSYPEPLPFVFLDGSGKVTRRVRALGALPPR